MGVGLEWMRTSSNPHSRRLLELLLFWRFCTRGLLVRYEAGILYGRGVTRVREDNVLGVEMDRMAGDRARRAGALNADRSAAERWADAIFVAISIDLEGW